MKLLLNHSGQRRKSRYCVKQKSLETFDRIYKTYVTQAIIMNLLTARLIVSVIKVVLWNIQT